MLILDFDGTVTDAEAEGAPFRAGYLEDLSILTGQPLEAVTAIAEEIELAVQADPNAHGWIYDGRIVAPATVDPYLRVMPVARAVFDRFHVFGGADDRRRLLDGILYKYNYQKTRIAFRPRAYELLRALIGTDSYVVTNSHTDPVQAKIRALGEDAESLDWWLPRVRGSARKYAVDDSFDAIDATMELPGLERPVLLRRRLYHDALAALLKTSGAAWADLVVVGDIFELDLALPLALGGRVGLVVNEFTPDYERAFVDSHPRGTLLTSLDDVLPMLEGSHGHRPE
jgi:FMN phosphatase YigB (HAD superfamily)